MDVVRSKSFPRVLASGDAWAAFEWIEGETVAEQELSQDIVEQATRLLAAIHSAKIEPLADTPEAILNEVRLKLQERLPILVSRDIISADESQRVVGLSESLSPASLNVSLVHGDFSPANLVISGKELYSVDNEKIRFHVADYDVCRAVTFWNEWNLSGSGLLGTYLMQSRRELAAKDLFFWGVFDLVYRISHRISSFGELNEFCVMKLRAILKTGAFQ